MNLLDGSGWVDTDRTKHIKQKSPDSVFFGVMHHSRAVHFCRGQQVEQLQGHRFEDLSQQPSEAASTHIFSASVDVDIGLIAEVSVLDVLGFWYLSHFSSLNAMQRVFDWSLGFSATCKL